MSVSLRHQPHVVAVLFFLAGHALRDVNDHSSVTVGVGSQGQAFKLAPDDPEEKNAANASSGNSTVTSPNETLAENEQDSEQQKAGDAVIDKAVNVTAGDEASTANATNATAGVKPVTAGGEASTANAPNATAGVQPESDGGKSNGGDKNATVGQENSTKKAAEKRGANQTTQGWKVLKNAVLDEEDLYRKMKLKLSGSPLLGWSMSLLSEHTSKLYQKLWSYNPFRLMVGHATQTLKDDTSCGTPEEFLTKTNLTVGEQAMCNLRFIMLVRCKLPTDTCVTCSCPKEDESCVLPNEVGLDACWQALPAIFFKWYVALAAIIILSHILLSPLLTRLYKRAMQEHRVERFIKEFVGTVDNHPKRQAFRIYLLVIQIFASGLNVVLFCLLGMFEGQRFPWKLNSSGLEENWNGWLQFVMNIQMLVNYYVTWTKQGFTWPSILTANAVIDVLTVHQSLLSKALYTPVVLYPKIPALKFDLDKEFLFLARPNMNWHWLRSYRCLSALLEIQDMGALRHFTPVAQQVMKSGLRLWALVTCFCGCMTFMEYLGHDFELNSHQPGLKNVGECQVEKSMHDNLACIPFLVGIYWVFTTISTVGYGDFVPHSAITYIYVICVIVLGVTFFSVESGTLIDVMELEHHGLGPAPVKGSHVVLTGGAMRDVDEDVLYAFLIQLFHGSLLEQGYVWPEVVIFGKVNDPDDVNKFLEKRLTGEMRRNIIFCNGDPLKPEGMEQAKISSASFVFILPSSQAEDWDSEDEFNMHVALSVKSLSRAAYVLVLFRPSSLKMAIMSGLHPAQCCCMNRLRTAIMSQSVRVRGWPQLLNLMTCCSTSSAEGGVAYCKEILLPDDYIRCCANSAWGFALSKHAAGRSFRDLAMEMYEATGALAICAQINGQVVACPIDQIMDPNIIVYCISPSEPKLLKAAGRFISEKTDWGSLYVETREESTQNKALSLEEISRHVHAPPELFGAKATSAEDMNTMLEKSKKIIAEDPHFCVAVLPVCEDGKLWPLLCQFVDKFGVQGSDSDNPLRSMSIVALVPEVPPQTVTDYLKGVDEVVQVALVHGDWTKPDVLRQFGVEQCKTLVCFPIRSLRADPANDSKTLTLLRLLNRMKLRAACFVLVELTSGMSGAHMMPRPPAMIEHGQEYLQPSTNYLMEEAYNPFCAAGSIWVPRSLMGTVARSYYTNGLLEVLQAVTFDGKGLEEVRVEQIQLPKQFFGQKYKELVLAGLFGSVGPASILVLGLLRETLYSEAALLNPPPESRLLESDLVIVLANGMWACWAQEQGIRCLGGRDNRKL
mmetsp:Transcript_21020/g.38422  ORF Transcript_21020/g.38422 Transcript_21020/m.38422 type:complete len:1292 (+) Transcript_21020:54-3929(+)